MSKCPRNLNRVATYQWTSSFELDDPGNEAQFGVPVQKSLPILFQLVMLFSLCMTSVAADKKERNKEPLPKPPPQAVEQMVKVRRGEKITIPLRIYGSQRETLKFLIRKEPENGKVSEPQVRDRESAVVIYEPPADLGITRDLFSYAVQNSAGVSAAADVSIAIVDEAPALIIPDSLTFLPILTGQTSAQEIEISNRGGGIAEGEITADAPWRIEGSTRYRLEAGEKRMVKLVFAPATPGPFRGELHFSSDRTRTVGLRGEAQAALAAVPPAVELQAISGEVVRTGIFELINGGTELQTVKLTGSNRLRVPQAVDVPAAGRARIIVQSEAGSVEAIAEELTAEGAGVQVRIPVKASPVGPVLRRLGEQLNFGNIAPGRGGSATIEVQNVGGAEGYWKWELIPPFTAPEADFRLAAGAHKTLTVQLDPAAVGQFRTVLKLIGEQQAVEVPTEASVISTTSAPTRLTRHPSPPSHQASAPVRPVSVSSPEKPEKAPIPLAPGDIPLLIKVQTSEPTRAVVAWSAKRYPYEGTYRLETQSLSLSKEHKLDIRWNDVPSARFTANEKQVAVEVDRLAPSTLYNFRVVNIPPGTNVPTPIGTFELVTPAKEPFVKFTVLRALFLLLAGCIGFMAWRYFRAH